MKILRRIIIILNLFTWSDTIFSQEIKFHNNYNIPSIETVLRNYLKYYSFEIGFTGELSQLIFEKKGNTWLVAEKLFTGEKILHEESFWKDGQFRKLDYFKRFNKTPENDSSLVNQILEPREKMNYNLHPFYGYPHWENDVILFLEPRLNKLNDSLIYSLARAYSSLNSVMFDGTSEIVFREGGNCMTSKQEESLIFNTKKAIWYFELLDSINPGFITVIGTIHTKMCNEYVDLYLKLWTFKSVEKASIFLPSGLYKENVLSSAKNMLNSCKPNSILITYEDNDTYPLLYLQASQNFRRDVSVINISLFYSEYYRDALTRDIGNNKLEFNIGYKDYSTRFDYVVKNRHTENTINFRKFCENIILENSSNAPILKDKYIELTRGSETYKPELDSILIYRIVIGIWDLIESNPDKAIQFSNKSLAKDLGLQNHFFFNGFTFELCQDKTKKYDVSLMLDFLKNGFTSGGFLDTNNFVFDPVSNSYLDSRYFEFFITNLLDVAELIIINKENTKTTLILKEFLNSIPLISIIPLRPRDKARMAMILNKL